MFREHGDKIYESRSCGAMSKKLCRNVLDAKLNATGVDDYLTLFGKSIFAPFFRSIFNTSTAPIAAAPCRAVLPY